VFMAWLRFKLRSSTAGLAFDRFNCKAVGLCHVTTCWARLSLAAFSGTCYSYTGSSFGSFTSEPGVKLLGVFLLIWLSKWAH
jgi:hypothetical protein